MHSNASPHPFLGRNSAKVPLKFLLLIFFLTLEPLFITISSSPAQGQDSVAPAAIQTSTPQFGSRIAPGPTSKKQRGNARSGLHRGSPQDELVIYANGPIDGNTYAWGINYGFAISNSFNYGIGSINSLTFGAWLAPGDVLQSVEVSFTSQPLGGTSYYDQVVTLTQSGCSNANQYGYVVCTETGNLQAPFMYPGTYWLNLQNAVVNNGDEAFWDQNGGVGCTSYGCPSQAEAGGTIPPEAFTLLGTSTTFPACEYGPPGRASGGVIGRLKPATGQTFQVLYNFTGGADGGAPQGLKMTAPGTFYGTAYGTASGPPVIYKLRQSDSGWVLIPLTSRDFSETVNLAPDGSIYAASSGYFSFGSIFTVAPSPSVPPMAISNWNLMYLHDFDGGSDGCQPNPDFAFDPSGNIYGSTYWGGAGNGGIVFELTPSAFGWTENVLYSFETENVPYSFERAPLSVIFDGAGNLYGELQSGQIFELSPSAGGWILQTLYTFDTWSDGATPDNTLIFDSSGNLYGTTLEGGSYGFGTVFQLTPAPGSWTIHTLYNFVDFSLSCLRLVIDSSGSLYCSKAQGGAYNQGFIFKLTPSQGGWTATSLHDFTGGSDGGMPYGADLILDASGNLYGTAQYGGNYGQGVVWEITP